MMRETHCVRVLRAILPYFLIFFAALVSLLAFALAPPCLALCNTHALIEQALSDALHMRVRLGHLGKEAFSHVTEAILIA